MSATRFAIAMVGAGAVATHLAHALATAGHRITGVWSRRQCSAERLGLSLGGVVATTDMAALPAADLYVVSVKDDAIASVVSRLGASIAPSSLVVHTAGSVPCDVLRGFARHGVIYPMQTFSLGRAVDFARVPVAVEGSSAAVEATLAAVAATISESVTHLSSAQRAHLHLAAVFACNFTNACLRAAAEVCQQHAIDPAILDALVAETVAKVRTLSPHAAQTGPARRHDTAVMQRQHDLLSDAPDLQRLYDAVSHYIASQYHD